MVDCNSAYGRGLGLGGMQGPFQLKPSYDSMVFMSVWSQDSGKHHLPFVKHFFPFCEAFSSPMFVESWCCSAALVATCFLGRKGELT